MLKFISVLFLIPIFSIAAENPSNTGDGDDKNTAVVNPFIYDRTVNDDMKVAYKKIFTALENNGYFVTFELNLGKNLSHFAKRWGKDYNVNKLDSIRSMIFCNGSYANQLSNIDPSMLALCPLRITLYSKNNQTHILFVRPGKVAGKSKAQKLAKELEDDVIRTIEVAITS